MPKPPPMSGQITRRRCSGWPRCSATSERSTWGVWWDDQSVSTPVPSSRAARQARASSGTPVTASEVNVSEIAIGAPAKAAATSPPPPRVRISTLSGQPSCSRGASLPRAASMSTTAASGSYDAATRPAPSSAA